MLRDKGALRGRPAALTRKGVAVTKERAMVSLCVPNVEVCVGVQDNAGDESRIHNNNVHANDSSNRPMVLWPSQWKYSAVSTSYVVA